MQRVLIVENHLLVGAGIQALLTRQPSLEVCGIVPNRYTDLVDGIQRFHPDVVVLGEGNHLGYLGQLLPLMNDRHRFRILVISPDIDIVRIYEKQEAFATSTSQLVDLIRRY